MSEKRRDSRGHILRSEQHVMIEYVKAEMVILMAQKFY